MLSVSLNVLCVPVCVCVHACCFGAPELCLCVCACMYVCGQKLIS